MTLLTEDIRERWRDLRAEAPATAPKLMALADAVRAHVKDADTLYFGGSMARPNAAMFEVARQFWNRKPGFTLAAPAIANQHAPLIRRGLVHKVISSIHALTFPTPGPHPLYVAAARSGEVQFEDLSLLTLVQRLMAASLGLPFMPTRSLAGSDMLADLAGQGIAAQVDNPFGADPVTVVAPLAPHVTFMHGVAADEDGNVVICPPLYDDKWAAFAASRAVIITVERIVSRETLRRYAHLVQVPACRVTAVCEVPFGGHPNSLPGDLVAEVSGYPDDYEFLEALRVAGIDEANLDAWSDEWIVGCKGHSAYLEKLGASRLHALRGRTFSDGWEFEIQSLSALRAETPATEAERHVVLASRVLQRRFATGQVDCVLAGLGISSLAAWIAALHSREHGSDVALMVEAGMFGYLPAPGDPFLFNYRNMFSSTMLSDTLTTLGVLTCGPDNRAIGVLGAAQVDQYGCLNTTRLPNFLLTGSGGANDIASGASDVLVTIAQGKKRLVERVDFITSPGRNVSCIVTPAGVLERQEGRFVLTQVLARGSTSPEELVRGIQAECSWDLVVSTQLEVEAEPTPDELRLARLIDPEGRFLKHTGFRGGLLA